MSLQRTESDPSLGNAPAFPGDAPPFRSAALAVGVMLVLLGSLLQSYLNGTFDALFLALVLLIAGTVTVRLLFRGKGAEQRAFFLTFGICVFAGGLAQWHSRTAFGELQSTPDAVGFFSAILDSPPYFTFHQYRFTWLEERGPIGRGAPLATWIWQWVYHHRLWLGFDFGLYIGLIFNAMVMGFAASITVRTAREIFGDDPWRLRRVATLFAFCGLFILFGAILLRDCFTTFFNALVLWGIVRWLQRPGPRTFLPAILLTALSAFAMMHLRDRTLVMFGLFWFLAVCAWFLARRFNLARLLAVFAIVIIAAAGSTYIMRFIDTSRQLQARHSEQYDAIFETQFGDDSLAIRMIVRQPLPIRLILGTGSLMIFPIPSWAYFYRGVGEYHLIKGYHGLYQILVMPLVLAGFLTLLRLVRKDRQNAIPLLFLGVYLVVNFLAVVATSLEQRHIAQFMPAFMILAALPDTRNPDSRLGVRKIALAWFILVILVHLAWAVAARGR